ncbi:MAG: SAM-dependent chlorinase/fluorinase [Acidobacteria bacterium]|nr:SAM-dependent chlorinase/fluorinase [Acidobacteriota bacterium]
MRTITLLTDFGTRDPYVAAMKGVLAARCSAPVFDLSHDIAPFDILGAAFFLRDVVNYWPPETIFVVVIDPGVGTSRRMLAVEREDRIFLAPDNGVLQFVMGRAFSIERESLFLPNGSNTFHGRDRFAPVAAAIANGFPLADLGPPVDNPVRLPYGEPVYEAERIRATVVGVDRFGNVISDIENLPFAPCARIGGVTIDRLERNYGDAGDGPFFLIGSAGRLEISIRNASAAAALQLRAGDRLDIVKCLTE